MKLPPDTVLFAGPDDAKDDALSYIGDMALNKDDLKLVVRGDVLCVVAKRGIEIGT